MPAVNGEKNIPKATTGFLARGREAHTVDRSVAVVVDEQRVDIFATQEPLAERPQGPDVMIMVSGGEVMQENADFGLGGSQH